MRIRENFQKLANKKLQEVQELELRIREAKAYIQALEDSMKLLPRDASVGLGHTLRPNTNLAKARDAIKAAGVPMSIAELLKAIGKPQDKKHRVSLAGTLSGYARDGKVFTKTAPNTFSLIELGTVSSESGDELPEEFGSMR
jgi:hypothetical protein